MKQRRLKLFMAFLMVFLAGRFVDLSFDFSAEKFYRPATYEVAVKVAGYRRKGGGE